MESRLHIRQKADLDYCDLTYEQNDHAGHEERYGLPKKGLATDSLNGAMIQEIGSINPREGRLLAVPNILQHKAEPSELQYHPRSGWRRFVALWLVDPNDRVLSTANVPLQQFDCWQEMLLKGKKIQLKLLPELTEQIMGEGSKMKMTMEEARAYPLELTS